jgi:hypothetical protein
MAQPGKKVKEKRTYNNPVIDYSLPDPTIIRLTKAILSLSTEDIRTCPLHRSANLVTGVCRHSLYGQYSSHFPAIDLGTGYP